MTIVIFLSTALCLFALGCADLLTSSKTENRNMSDLTNIRWAHAVNKLKQLKEALIDEYEMLEADVVMGRVNGSHELVAIMAHPPVMSSDLSLKHFLEQVKNHNAKYQNEKKGIKLDFKSIEAFETAVLDSEVAKQISQADYPVWLNADILKGPLALSFTTPVDPTRFLKGSKEFSKAVLSLGWTTGIGDTDTKPSYTDQQITEMLQIIKEANVTQPITFAVRADFVAESLTQMEKLLETLECTLTIWSLYTNKFTDVEKLRSVILKLGVNKTYIDVNPELRKLLNI